MTQAQTQMQDSGSFNKKIFITKYEQKALLNEETKSRNTPEGGTNAQTKMLSRRIKMKHGGKTTFTQILEPETLLAMTGLAYDVA